MSYVGEVLSDGPRYYWPMAAGPSPLPEEGGGPSLNLTGATSLAAGSGPLHSSQDEGAWSFDGVDDSAQSTSALTLSDIATITVEFLLRWDIFVNNTDQAIELGAGDAAGGFLIAPNASSPANTFGIQLLGTPLHHEYITRPSAAVWHHYAFVFDRPAVAADQMVVYVDGGLTATTPVFLGDKTGNFADLVLNVMCRNGTALFGAGDMAHLAIYPSALSAARASAHFDAIGIVLPSAPPGVYRATRVEGASGRYG